MRMIDADAYLDSIKPRGISDELWKECKEYKSITAFPAIEIEPHWIPCNDCEKKCKKWENLKTSQE